MAQYKIALIPGDGIGPEILREGVKVLRSVARVAGLSLDMTEYEAGAALYLRTGVGLPKEVFEACAEADAIYLAAVGLPEARHPDGTEVQGDIMFKLRFDLDLYAGVRPIKLYPGIKSPLVPQIAEGIDYIIVRESVEGLYSSRGGGCLVRDQLATDTLVVTREGTEKVCRAAFKLAAQRQGRPSDGKSMVTCVDKSNVLRSYAFFRKVYDDVAAEFPAISRDYAYVDAMTLYMVLRPREFDVVVAENMFGDIISDLGAATVGGLGMAPSGDIGDEHAMFQPSHGTAPSLAGKGIANPIATILSGGMMLDWLGRRNNDEAAIRAGAVIDQAVAAVLRETNLRTPDIGGTARTAEMGDAIAAKVEELW